MRFSKSTAGLSLLIVLALAVVAARLYLPYWVKDYVNAQINRLDGYGGGIQDVDISLWRGAYQIKGLEIHKTDTGGRDPFIAARLIDISVEWRALFHGSIVAELDIYGINLIFKRTQTGEGANWPQLVDRLTPLEINRLEVHDGRVAYIDRNADPDVNIYIDITQAQVTNLRNVEGRQASLPSELHINGKSVGGGELQVNGKVNILRDIPDFDVAGQLEGASLVAFNDYANKLALVDFEKGRVGFYTELAAAKGRMQGYVKVIADDVSFIDLQEQDTSPLDVVWESLVSVFVEIFKNHPADQFALRVPITGNLDNPEQDGWAAFISIFQNAFGRAFTRNTDGSINFADLLEHSEKDQPARR